MTQKLPVVIYVDDEPDNITVTKASLEDWYEVVGFESPVEALKQIPILKPEIVLSDLKMAAMTGVEFLELVHQVYPASIRIIITGNSDEQAVISAIRRAKVFDFLKKPFLAGAIELKEVLDKAYEKFQSNDEESRQKRKITKPDLMEHPSWLHKISNQLKDTFNGLPQYRVTDKQIESWSLLIHLAMSAEKRYYHNTQHLFDISSGASYYEKLAILFHDVVYVQVDVNSTGGILPQIVETIKPLTPDKSLKLTLPELSTLPKSNDYALLYQIFGKKSGDVLSPVDGLNEFLSALVAQKTLSSTLTSWDVIKVLSCIELTIPFRAKDSEGKFAPDRLLNRIKKLNKERKLQQSDEEIEKVVQRAVDVTNRDLWGFSAADPGDFLNGSWKLILEGNASLQKELHTPKDYRTALEKMEGFISFLTPEIIFQRINSFPSDREYALLRSQCHYNLEAGRTYFRAKILAMAIFEVLDDLTGGKAPVEVFRGDIGSETNNEAKMIEDLLDSSIPQVGSSENSQIVIELLKVKTNTTISYDLKNSPLALYLYLRMTKHDFENSLKTARAYFKGEIEAFDLIKVFPKDLIVSVLQSISQISKSRETEILQIAKLRETLSS